MKNIKHILDRLREVYQVPNNRQLSTKIEVNYNTMATWIKRDIVPYEKLHDLVQKENISFDWLLSGEGNKYKNNLIEYKSNDYVPFYHTFKFIGTNPTVPVIINSEHEIDKDNPLLKSIISSYPIHSLNKLLLVSSHEEHINCYVKVDSFKIIKSFLESIDKNKSFVSHVICRNNLMKKNYPYYENQYLGVELIFNFEKDTEVVECTILTFSDNFYGIIKKITPKDLEKLTILAMDIESLDEIYLGLKWDEKPIKTLYPKADRNA